MYGDIKLENTQSLQKVNVFGACAKSLGNRESQINLQIDYNKCYPTRAMNQIVQ